MNNTQPTPIRTVDQLVGDLVEAQAAMAALADHANTLKAQIADRVGVGGEHKYGDVTVTVREPNRRFNLDKAVAMLTPEQLTMASTTIPDAKKVRSFLPPVLLEQCMDAGTGAPVVTVR